MVTKSGVRQVPKIRKLLKENARPYSANELSKIFGVRRRHINKIMSFHQPHDVMTIPSGVKGYDLRSMLWMHTDHRDAVPVPKKHYGLRVLKALKRGSKTINQLYKKVTYSSKVKDEVLRFMKEGIIEIKKNKGKKMGARYGLTALGKKTVKNQGRDGILTPSMLDLLRPQDPGDLTHQERVVRSDLMNLVNAGREYKKLREGEPVRGDVSKLSRKYGFNPSSFKRQIEFRSSPLTRFTEEGAEYHLWLVREQDPSAERWIRGRLEAVGVKFKPSSGKRGQAYKKKLEARKERWVRDEYSRKIPELGMGGAHLSIINQLNAHIREVKKRATETDRSEAAHLEDVAGILRKMRDEQMQEMDELEEAAA